MLKNQNTIYDDPTVSTANAPAPGPVVTPASYAAFRASVDDIAIDIAAALELLSAADELALYAADDGNSPIHAVVSRALRELRTCHDSLCAIL